MLTVLRMAHKIAILWEVAHFVFLLPVTIHYLHIGETVYTLEKLVLAAQLLFETLNIRYLRKGLYKILTCICSKVTHISPEVGFTCIYARLYSNLNQILQAFIQLFKDIYFIQHGNFFQGYPTYMLNLWERIQIPKSSDKTHSSSYWRRTFCVLCMWQSVQSK